MAGGSTTIYNFEIALSDTVRHVYEDLSLQVARHPSESSEYLLTRVFAYCLEYRERLEFSRGLQEPDEPALWARDLTGRVTHWIEVGMPSAEKLNKASKRGAAVSVYTYKNPALLIEQLQGERIHNAEAIKLNALDGRFLGELDDLLDRRNRWELSVAEGHLYVTVGGRTIEGEVCALTIV